MNSAKKILILALGCILLLAGLAFVLEIAGIQTSSLTILFLGIILLFLYFGNKNRILLYCTYFAVTIGIVNFLFKNSIIPSEFNSFSFVLAIGLSLLAVYITNKQKSIFYVSCAVILFDIIALIAQMFKNSNCILGYSLLTVGIMLVVLFIVENNRMGFIPLIISVVAYLGGIINLLFYYKIIQLLTFKLITAGILIVLGIVLILYVQYKNKKVDKDVK